jgi:hypothetical protein
VGIDASGEKRKRTRKPSTSDRWAVLDVEARDWDRFRVAHWRTTDGDSESVTTLERLGQLVRAFQGRVWGHYLGRYDVFFLPPPNLVVLSGSAVVRAQLGRAQLHDSWELFRVPLAELGRHVGRPKLAGLSESMNDATDAEAAKHAENDTAILHEALADQLSWWRAQDGGAEWPTTAGGSAMALFERREPEVVRALASNPLTLQEWREHHGAVVGARTEVFHLGHVNGPLTCLDLRSSYPARWLEGPLPCGPWGKVNSEVKGKLGVYLCDVRQPRGRFPLVAPEFQWRFDGRAWLTSEEIKAVRAARGAVRVVRGFVSMNAQMMGRGFFPGLYAEKATGRPGAKAIINAATGKTLQGPGGVTYVLERGGYCRDVELGFLAWYQRPLVGAFIHGRARLALWMAMDALRAAGWRVFYVDTDGLHTDCPPELLPAEIHVGLAAGEWKVEGVAEEAVYLGPKFYGLRLPGGGVKLVTSGVPSGAVSWEKLLRAARGLRVDVEARAGLDGFLSVSGQWGPRAAVHRRTLCLHTGGKSRVRSHPNGNLWYADAGDNPRAGRVPGRARS